MDVTVGIISDGYVTVETVASLGKMFNAHPEFQSRLITVRGGCADLADNRNKVVRLFLNSRVEWLLFVDTDMVWEPEDWARLRDSADPGTAPYVSATYMVANEPPKPCAAVFLADGFHTLNLTEDSPELQGVSAVGSGFSLIHRGVFLKTADVENDHEWYEHGRRAPNGQTLPEDYAFCSRVGEAGIPIHLNTKVRVGHIKPKVIGWKEYMDGN